MSQTKLEDVKPQIALNSGSSYFSMGLNTHKVPMSMHKENRERLTKRFPNHQNCVILLQGAKEKTRDATDHEPLIRQESYFQYLFGVMEPDCFGAIHIGSKKSILFIPRLPQEYAIWMGEIKPKENFKNRYEVDEVYYVDEINSIIGELNSEQVLLLQGPNSDSGKVCKPAKLPKNNNLNLNFDLLHKEISECRVIKSKEEIDVLRYVARISSEAHVHCMQAIKPGMREYQLESLFKHYCYYYGGCRHMSYTCICGSGINSATLHYGHAGAPNDKQIEDGDMCLFDMGGEYHCYGSDITCSYPANGKFTKEQVDIYEAVLNAVKAVESKLKPGISWTDMHIEAERAFLCVLKDRGYIKGEIEEMMKIRLGALFMPHGLGHFIGLDTHDVGGYNEDCPPRSELPGLKSLRTARIMKEGMVLTVEPGVYFIKALLEPALSNEKQSQFLVKEKIESLMGFGGVRLEDDIVITADGIENFTRCPREIKDIEAVMAGATWNFDTLSIESS